MKHISDDTQLMSNLDTLPHVLGSTPLLVHNGEITATVQQSQSTFFTRSHPRTAVGIFPDGKWLLVVVDGRQTLSIGMSLHDLALYMQHRGCKEALNFDGGGSSTMILDKQIINVPSGREYSIVAGERPIETGIIVTTSA